MAKETRTVRLLGVNIDGRLNFSGHISEVCKKVSHKIGVVMRLRNLIPCNAKLLLYKSFILPHLTYCHLIWHFCKATHTRKLEHLQERALRAVNRSHADSYQDLLKHARLPTLANTRLQDIATVMYKVKNGLAPASIAELFSTNDDTYFLRNSDFIIPRYYTVCYGKHSIRFLGPWTKLMLNIRESPSLQRFKRNLRKLDLSAILNENDNCCSLRST